MSRPWRHSPSPQRSRLFGEGHSLDEPAFGFAAHQQAGRLAEIAYRALGCRGVSRVDLLLDQQGRFVVLEVNTIPGMTEASLVPKIAQGVGISFDELAERLLLGAALKA